ncbi:MAG: hypothetical protein JW884_12605 [Deltaproteobacteria bacterium]|nr:hypothetical protein [Deltaproteobacteria bacterium]
MVKVPTEEEASAGALIRSLKKEMERRIEGIETEASTHIEEIRKTARREGETYGDELVRETDRLVEENRRRTESQTLIDLKKLRSQVIEAFIEEMIAEAVNLLKTERRSAYEDFLLSRTEEGIQANRGSRTAVFLSEEDLTGSFKEKLSERLKGADGISIAADPSMALGGVVIVGEERGLRFNSSIDRILYRKAQAVRRVIAKILEKHDCLADIDVGEETP